MTITQGPDVKPLRHDRTPRTRDSPFIPGRATPPRKERHRPHGPGRAHARGDRLTKARWPRSRAPARADFRAGVIAFDDADQKVMARPPGDSPGRAPSSASADSRDRASILRRSRLICTSTERSPATGPHRRQPALARHGRLAGARERRQHLALAIGDAHELARRGRSSPRVEIELEGAEANGLGRVRPGPARRRPCASARFASRKSSSRGSKGFAR